MSGSPRLLITQIETPFKFRVQNSNDFLLEGSKNLSNKVSIKHKKQKMNTVTTMMTALSE